MLATRTIICAVLFCVLAGSGAMARDKGVTLQDRRQAACYDDVQRLCAEALPDVAKVTACMRPKKALVSAKCRALWDDAS